MEKAIKPWCDGLKEKTVSQDATRIEDVTYIGSPGKMLKDLIFSANWEKDVKGEGCPDRTRGTEPDQCVEAMTEILNTCQTPDPGNKFAQWGGSRQGDFQCVVYKIDIDNLGIDPA
jgi:hypothetical protein